MKFKNVILSEAKESPETSVKRRGSSRPLKNSAEFLSVLRMTNDGKKGFTLIELIIYLAIFSIVLAIAVELFFFSKTFESQVVQEQEVDRNARVAFLEMTQTIRSAASVSTPALGASADNVYLNSNAIRYFVNNGILQKTENSQTFELTSDEVTVENVTFTTRGQAGEKPTVSISFDVKTNTLVWGQPDYISKSFQTTVQLR